MPVRRGSNGVWRVEFQLAGVRVHCSARTRDRRIAEALERKLRQDVYDRRILGGRPAPPPCTLGDAVDRYVSEHLRHPGKPSHTVKNELYLLGRLVRHLGGRELELRDITSRTVADLKRVLVASGRARATANRYLATLRAVLRKTHREWEVLPELPVFQLFTLRNGRTRTLSADEEARLFRAAERNPSLARLLCFLLATGARLGEALKLAWPDVILESDPRPPRVTFRETKNGSTRTVPLPSSAVEMLREMRREQQGTGLASVFLCRVSHSRIQPYRRPHCAFRAACKAAGIEGLRMHDLRHDYASRLARAGVPLFKVSKLLGHRDLRIVARYSHLESADLDDVVTAVERRERLGLGSHLQDGQLPRLHLDRSPGHLGSTLQKDDGSCILRDDRPG